ncbi:histidine protein methyltransferase 1 homolog [Tubulanus polymorphus]|uniref:histidine protein methyltransferase 1 homolog n=1 Tax=Tubulanus polymorphus TaxID=672921 RepID=UPI003DA5476B
MSFKFNFSTDLKSDEEDIDKITTNKKQKTDDVRPAKKITISIDPKDLEEKDVKVFTVDDETEITFVDIANIPRNAKDGDGEETIAELSDLVPNIYEGGLKIWECSLDLTDYLRSIKDEINFNDKSVLELGCGAGLPGIYAYKNGADVMFSDYNEDVLESVTIPNVLLNTANCDKNVVHKRCQFWSGDWSSLQQRLKNRFDVILSSETIYNPSSYAKLYDMLKSLLKPDGRIYLAAKTYYFGVGGGTRQFESLVKTEAEFDIEVCKEYSEGVNREILHMTWKSDGDG